jgi:hypothetical protein
MLESIREVPDRKGFIRMLTLRDVGGGIVMAE